MQIGKTSAKSTILVLNILYNMPVVGKADTAKWTNFTLKGSYKVIDRLVSIDALTPFKTGDSVY